MKRPASLRIILVTIVGLLISSLAVRFLASSVDLGAAGDLLITANPPILVASLVVLAVGIVVRTARWRLLLPTTDAGDRVAVRRLIKPVLVGYLANVLLPARLGEGVRAAAVWRLEHIGLPETLGSVAVERVLDTAVVALLGLVAGVALQAPPWIVIGTGVITLVAWAIVAILLTGWASELALRFRRVPRLANAASRFLRGASVPDRGGIRGAITLTVLGWMLDAAVVWLTAAALSVPLNPAQAMAISAVTVLGTAIPSAPGYIGTYELAASATGTALGLEPETALALAILVHATTLMPLTAAGIVAAITMGPDVASDLRRVRPSLDSSS